MNSLFEKFNTSLKTGTPAEKRLARYYLEHPGEISYETAASVADRLDLSPMTVGRFLRSMDIDTLAQQVPGRVPAPAMPVERHHANAGLEAPATAYSHVRDQVEALYQVQALASQPVWKQVIELLSRPSEIFMTAHGPMLPMSAYFCLRLGETRDGVRHLNGGDGTYLDLLGTRRDDCLLVILDDRIASQRLHRLSRAAREDGHRVLLFTHAQDRELDDICDLVLRTPVHEQQGGMDPVALTAMIELAVAGVSAAKGPFAIERAGRVAELQRYFSEPA